MIKGKALGIRVVVSVVLFSLLMSCASYGVGGVYTSANQAELGGYIFGDSKYSETTVSYTSVSEKDLQLLGAGFSLKFPIPFEKLTVFPLATIEYQGVLNKTKDAKDFGWVRFGAGLDFPLTDTFYLRGEGMYAPDLSSSLPKSDIVALNPAKGYSLRFGLGWQQGPQSFSNSKAASSNTNKTQDQSQNQAQTNVTPTASTGKDGWDIASLDTARNVNYLSDLEKDIILEMNMARSNPGKYAEMYINPNQGAYARECYEELRRSGSLPLLFPKRGLSQAAKDHAADTGPKGTTGHTGTNGSSLSDRINRYGTWRSGASENISYGYNTAREIVLQLLIDDGVESRGHRRNIMNAGTKYAGVAVGTHTRYRYMCVQDFAVDYTDR